MKIAIRQKGRKSSRDRTMVKVLESPAFMASGIPIITLSSDPNELCARLKILLKIQGGNNSNTIDDENVAIADNLL